MYAQMVKSEASNDDPEQLAAFQARIDAGEKIEPKDWMPEGYRKTLIRQIGQHAHSEIVGQLPEATGSPAPPRWSVRPFCWPRCRTRQDMGCICIARQRHWAFRATR